MPVGNAAPPRPRKPGLSDGLDDLGRRMLSARLQTLVTAVGDIVVDADRIDDADARKGQPLLTLELGDFFGEPEVQRMRAPFEEAGVEQTGNILAR